MSHSDAQSRDNSPMRTPDSADSADRALSLATTANTDASLLSDSYLGLASTPPRLDDWISYPYDLSEAATLEARRAKFPSEQLPSPDALAKAAQLTVLDADARVLPFSSLYEGRQYYGQQRLIIFIRHFYCRACKGFVRNLKQYFSDMAAATPSSPNQPSPAKSIVLIGCGHPSLIHQYKEITQCPYPVYTDPSLVLLKTLGCARWGGRVPGHAREYTAAEGAAAKIALYSMWDMVKALRPEPAKCDGNCDTHTGEACPTETRLRRRSSKDALRGGPIVQIGGEFLFEQGELVWCHRMKSVRGHMEPRMLRKVLDPADSGPAPPAKDPPKSLSVSTSASSLTAARKASSRVVPASASPSASASAATSPDLSAKPRPTAAKQDDRPKQAWSKAEYTLLPGSHIVQMASKESLAERSLSERSPEPEKARDLRSRLSTKERKKFVTAGTDT